MSWDIVMVISLRSLIADLDSSCFTDDRLKQLLVVAAQYVMTDANIETDYTINITSPNISPDPTATDTQDLPFSNLTVLKAACIIDRGNARLAAAINGLEARCGPAQMKVSRRMDGFSILLDQGYCGAYKEALRQYLFGNVAFCRAILSPFVNANFQPHHHDHDHRLEHPFI